ncbi:endolytic transglycosylase MltG [Corynebacterium hindlerae]|uniref:endolytic transglycosylase MltG n=1 Tax=Corynebacterium hindlerae TaxID=699041 RepID=UPI001AD6EB87|nr:endolytic transglycosylase MltG [Corynebacterium hindlerae]QTH58719.1 endolytic transglycosylase MltG [Corynebacterium hindlerae]
MRMEPKYRKRRERGLAVLVACLLLIIGAIVFIGYTRANPPSLGDFKGAGNGEEVMVEIAEGESVSQLGPELVKLGVVKSNGAYQRAAGQNDAAATVSPGFYRVQKEMSAADAVAALVDPKNKVELLQVPGGQTLADVTVVGGETRKGIYSTIEDVTCKHSNNCVNVAQLEQVAASADPKALGVPEWAVADVVKRGNDPKRLEGLITPGQYVINPSHDATAILTDLITRSAKQYEDSGIVERSAAMKLTPYQLLTAASLVEREAPRGDFDKVARVILNRLAEPMRLEFDSTVNYGLPTVEVATTDEDRKRETPWNTYTKEGLPETPISAASMEAIEAMENPAEGDWLFFVTVSKDGTTKFNRTFEDHQRDTNEAIANGVLDSQR